MLGDGLVHTLRAAFAPDMEGGASADVAVLPAVNSGSDAHTSDPTKRGVVPETASASPAHGARKSSDDRSVHAAPIAEDTAKAFPETWRLDMAGRDKAFLKTLERFDSPAALAKAYRELTVKLSSGELRATKPPGNDATPEQITAWRIAHGLPENAAAYVAGLELQDGTVAGKAEEPLLASFAEQAMQSNWTHEQYNQAVGWYFATQDRLMADRRLADAQFKEQSSSDLFREWGSDYGINRNAVVQFLDRHFPQAFKIDLLNARLSDGKLLANHPSFNKAVLELAKIISPSGTVLPNTSGAGFSGMEGRIAEIEGKYMRAPHGSDAWKTYWTGEAGARMQQEYRGLLAAREQVRRGRTA